MLEQPAHQQIAQVQPAGGQVARGAVMENTRGTISQIVQKVLAILGEEWREAQPRSYQDCRIEHSDQRCVVFYLQRDGRLGVRGVFPEDVHFTLIHELNQKNGLSITRDLKRPVDVLVRSIHNDLIAPYSLLVQIGREYIAERQNAWRVGDKAPELPVLPAKHQRSSTNSHSRRYSHSHGARMNKAYRSAVRSNRRNGR